MERYRLVFCGSGGQGIITAAIILAEAAVVHDGLEAVQSQSYGAAARGGVTRSDVIISDTDIDFPKVVQPNLLVCLTQESFNRFYSILRPGGLMILDSDLVEPGIRVEARQYRLPMHKTVQQELGSGIALNLCMLGALLCLKPLVTKESVLALVKERFAGRYGPMNEKALELGWSLGLEASPCSDSRRENTSNLAY